MTRFFLNLLLPLALLSLPAQAQTLVSKDQANQYFDNCVMQAAQTEQRLSPDSQQRFCACTAARLTQFFTIEDMQTMADTSKPEARLAVNKMIIDVYAPCMDEPVREYHYSTCISNPQVGAISSNPQALCQCAADEIAAHLSTNGPRLFSDVLARNPQSEDPMQALYDDAEFQRFAQTKLTGCLR